MYYSKYNLIVPLEKYPEFSIIHNLFHGKATIVDLGFTKRLSHALAKEAVDSLPSGDIDLLKSRSFVYATEDEENDQVRATFNCMFAKQIIRRYQVLLTYTCNLRCNYCFQKNLHEGATMTRERLALALTAIDELEKNAEAACAERGITSPKPMLYVAGGEPLQNRPEYIDLLEDIIAFVRARNMDYSFTSNGYDLAKLVPQFVKRNLIPSDIQVTLDGIGPIHDRRRPHVNGGSFDKIIEGIDAAVKAGIHISLRMNLDRENVDSFVELAQLVKDRGWCDNGIVAPYLAPVTNHSGVNEGYEWLEGEHNIFKTVMQKLQENPWLRQMFGNHGLKNFRGFEYVKSCVTEGRTPAPTFWRCESVLSQAVFDPDGNLFSCFEGAGNPRAQVGKYDPHYELFPDRVEEWAKLDSFRSPYCSGCRFAFICAGGCPWHVLRTGKQQCIAIKQQVTTAWNYFADLVIKEDKDTVNPPEEKSC